MPSLVWPEICPSVSLLLWIPDANMEGIRLVAAQLVVEVCSAEGGQDVQPAICWVATPNGVIGVHRWIEPLKDGTGVDDGGRSTGRQEVCKIWYGGHLKNVGCGNSEPYVSGQRCAKVEVTTC